MIPPNPLGYRLSKNGKWKPVHVLTAEQKQLQSEIQGLEAEIKLSAQRFAQSERDNEAKRAALDARCKHEVRRLEQGFVDETVFCCICGNSPPETSPF